ncbi:MAG: HutD family protein [Symbiobacteriaceae bacterium]|nr:HutD family protein [Symbiobacteriaceae bacterium]
MPHYEIVKAYNIPSSPWSGGVTRELAIYPKESSYAERTFQVRLSSADINQERSDFTLLPGYTRHIMPLTSAIKLKHVGDSEFALDMFKSYLFDGGVPTTSFGQCTDLNLMLGAGWEGVLLAVPKESTALYHPDQLMWIYCLHPVTLVCPELFPEGRVSLSSGSLFRMKSYQQPLGIHLEAEGNPALQVAVIATAWKKE